MSEYRYGWEWQMWWPDWWKLIPRVAYFIFEDADTVHVFGFGPLQVMWRTTK